MVAQARRSRLSLPLAPVAGVVCGVIVAFAIVLVPRAMLEDVLIGSGLPAILPAAEPPLGATARLGLTLVAAGGAGLLVWFLMFLAAGSRIVGFGQADDAGDPMVPVLRRADAHPDAPARRPLFAHEDLGTPFLDVRAAVSDGESSFVGASDDADYHLLLPMPELADDQIEPRSIPDDLDTPLSAFGPDAFPVAAIQLEQLEEPVAAMPVQRPQLFDPGDRFETFELTPMVRADGTAAATPIYRDPAMPRANTEATIAALLERLERSVARREDRADPHPPLAAIGALDQTLGLLRQMATRAG